jgi:hypothetical protein
VFGYCPKGLLFFWGIYPIETDCDGLASAQDGDGVAIMDPHDSASKTVLDTIVTT